MCVGLMDDPEAQMRPTGQDLQSQGGGDVDCGWTSVYESIGSMARSFGESLRTQRVL